MVNNDYTHWEMYAIGGSAEPTINSQGNRYLAPVNPFAKEVTNAAKITMVTKYILQSSKLVLMDLLIIR